MQTQLKIKKWGHSLGAVIPKNAIQKMNLKENELIKIEILTKKKADGFGIIKQAKSFQREENTLER